MKTILGAVAVSLLMFAACGGDGGSTTSPSGPGETAGGADDGGADSGGSSALGGEGATAGTLASSTGGAAEAGSSSDAGAGTIGNGGADADGKTSVRGHIQTFTGAALPGAVVMINGASALTDGDGAFTIEDVPATYDLTVIFEDDVVAWREVEIVDGLTTRELTLRLWQMSRMAGKAAVSGKITAVPKGREALVQVVGEHVGTRSQSLLAGDASYSLTDLQWEGGIKASAEVLALEWTPGNAGPTSYDGFARQSVELENGGDLPGTNLTFTKPAQKTVLGTVFADGAPMVFGNLNLGKISLDLPLKTGPFTVVVPDIGEPATITVTTQSLGQRAAVTAPATADALLSLEPPEVPKLILPVQDAHADAKTEFSFTRAGKLASVTWLTGSWLVVHVTDKTTVTLPDLTAAGIEWTDDTDDSHSWFVDTYGPADTPEEFLSLVDGTSPALTHGRTTQATADRHYYFAK
jgi:hypothetical protein